MPSYHSHLRGECLDQEILKLKTKLDSLINYSPIIGILEEKKPFQI